MMLNIVSEYLFSNAFLTAVGELCGERFPEVDELNHIEPKDAADYDRVLVLGTQPTGLVVRSDQHVFHGPSLRETLNTAGGLTKLSYAINQYLLNRPVPDDFIHPYKVITKPLDIWRRFELFDSFTAIVDIEVSGDITEDEPEDTELLSVSVLIKHEMVKAEDFSIFVWDLAALRDPVLRTNLLRVIELARSRVAHNGKFDFRWLTHHLGKRIYCDEDTMLMHHAMFHGAAEHGLKPLAQRILGAPEWEADLKNYIRGKSHYERIPQDVLVRYNSQDVYWTYMLMLRFQAMLAANPEARRAYRFEMAVSRMFQDVEAFGMPIDVGYTTELRDKLRAQFDDAVGHLHFLAGWALNPNSPKQVQKWFKAAGLDLKSTDANTMALVRMTSIDQLVLDLVDALLRARSLGKLIGTYCDGPLKKVRDGRVHPVFQMHGTTTGRLSCKSPNVQNVPNDDEGDAGLPSTRRVYSAPDGWVFVGADYSQAEMRVIAELADDEQMIYDLRADAPDFFDNMLDSVFPDIDFSTMSKSQRKPYRLKLKRIAYGSNYGRTPKAIATALTLEGFPTKVMEAVGIQDRYMGRYEGLDRWRKTTMENVTAGRWVTPFGRGFQQDVLTKWGYNSVQNAAWAFMPQSIASDICLSAALDLHKELQNNESPAHIVATVHDAIYVLSPEDEAERVLTSLVNAMEYAPKQYYTRTPFPVDGHIAKNWNEV